MEKDQVAPRRAPLGPEDNGGEWFALGAVEYKVAPLNFDALERHQKTIEGFETVAAGGKLPPASFFAGVAEVVHSAVVRNHPDATLEEIKQRLDVSNFRGVMAFVLRVGGVERKEGAPGKVDAPSPGAS